MDFSLHRSFPKELEDEWNRLLAESIVHVPFLRYEYLDIWWQTRGGGEWPETAQPAIIVAREGHRLVGIAPLFTTAWDGRPSLLLLGSIEISDYLDFIVRPEDLPAFTGSLLAFINTQEDIPKNLELYNVLDTSPTLPALESAASHAGWNYHSEPFRPSLTVPLTGDWETYLAGIDKKQRHEIRRKMRRAYTGSLPTQWYIAKDPQTIDQEIEDFLHLMAHDPEKARFLTPPMRQVFRQVMRCAFDRDYLLLAFLEIEDQKTAAYVSFDYLNQLWVYNSGMNREYIEFSPGWVLLGELLKWANENGRAAFDFMRGDEDYKYRFGAQRHDVMRLTARLE